MRILYVSYWGALEQLGQSLIIPAVKLLTRAGVEITLVTFEKEHDLANEREIKRVRQMLEEDGIEWIPLKYHKHPKVPATFFDIASGIAYGLAKRLRKKFDIIHARTYIGGLIGLFLAPLIGARFVYHNEGFYPDEQVDGGVWIKDSRAHRVAKRLENLMYSHADAIIVLSNRAKAIVENMPEVARQNTPVEVVPSCVDLQSFHLQKTETALHALREVRLVYIGSVGHRYILDKIGSFVAAARKGGAEVKLQIYSKADRKLISKMLRDGGLSDKEWELEAISYSEMPRRLSNFDAGLFFLTEGLSEHGCSPTKIGEYWAVGLPVITTPNVSDTDEIIRRENVGVIVKEHTEQEYQRAFAELESLLKDPEIRLRCRRAAENYYALSPACERQFALYKKIIHN